MLTLACFVYPFTSPPPPSFSLSFPLFLSVLFTVLLLSLFQVCISGIYIRLLVEGEDKGSVDKVPNPKHLFYSLWTRFLCEADVELYPPHHTMTSQATLPPSSSSYQSVAPSPSPPAEHDSREETMGNRVRDLCLRVMSRLYSRHAGSIGALPPASSEDPEGGMIRHMLRVLDLSWRHETRVLVMKLLTSLLSPPHAHAAATATADAGATATGATATAVGGAQQGDDSEGVLRVFKANAASFLSTSIPSSSSLSSYAESSQFVSGACRRGGEGEEVGGGVVLLVDLLSTALNTLSPISHALSSSDQDLSHDKDSLPPSEWFWFPGDEPLENHPQLEADGKEWIAAATTTTTAAAASVNRRGGGGGGGGGEDPSGAPRGGKPISKPGLSRLFFEGRIHPTSKVWAPGMNRPRALGTIRELRWWISSPSQGYGGGRGGGGGGDPLEVPWMALGLLTVLATSQPSYDVKSGSPLLPWPR